jgi:hypothetical protein
MNKLDHLRIINKFISDFDKINKPISEKLNNMIQSYYKIDKADHEIFEKILNNLHKEYNETSIVYKEYFAVMVEGKQTPSKLYENDYESAEKEATRLCTQTKNTAYVLKVVSKIELNEVKITRL